MCGIVAYTGGGASRDFILEGLSRLEYRGYDSAGFACIDQDDKKLKVVKEVGRIAKLKELLKKQPLDGSCGIGHTRWATHGIADQITAHPHYNCHKNIAVVHNGIIEEYEATRKKLIAQGHKFFSDTDSEIIAHLISSKVDLGMELKEIFVSLALELKGAFAVVCIFESYPDTLVLMRRRSPLAIGISENETFVASDHMVFADKTKQVIFMPEESFAIVKSDEISLYDFSGKEIIAREKQITFPYSETNKNGYEHFMLKEMYEQKQAIDRTISFYRTMNDLQNKDFWHQLGLTISFIKKMRSLHIAAAGSSWHAARIAQFFFEMIAKVPTSVHLASEFCYMPFFPEKNSLSIFVTQSGETADTLEALRMVNSTGLRTLALTNVPSSMVVREAGGALLMQAGPEISVCSTKAFSTQLASLYWFAHYIALERGLISKNDMKRSEEDLFVAAEVLESSMENYKLAIIMELAKKYSKFDRFIFLGRHISYPFSMEAALKLKEISYIFAQCYPAGELKHGPIALIDSKIPVVMFSVTDRLIYQKLVSNAREVKARKGHLLVFVFQGQQELINLADTAFIIPKVAPLLVPLAMTGVMQLFVYHITKELGRPIDMPRNLAKSVTVE